jgi:hypothetical protein
MYSTRAVSLCGVVKRDRTTGALMPYHGQPFQTPVREGLPTIGPKSGQSCCGPGGHRGVVPSPGRRFRTISLHAHGGCVGQPIRCHLVSGWNCLHLCWWAFPRPARFCSLPEFAYAGDADARTDDWYAAGWSPDGKPDSTTIGMGGQTEHQPEAKERSRVCA